MTRIKNLPEIKDVGGVVGANDIQLKSPNGRMFLKPEKMHDDKFIQAVIKKDVEVVGGTTPEVWVEDIRGTVESESGKKYSRKKITELTDKDKYAKEIQFKQVKEVV